jgi:hypothetical protein
MKHVYDKIREKGKMVFRNEIKKEEMLSVLASYRLIVPKLRSLLE